MRVELLKSFISRGKNNVWQPSYLNIIVFSKFYPIININNLDKFSELKLGGNKITNLKEKEGGGVMIIIRPPYMVVTSSNPSFRMMGRNSSIL